MSDQKETENVSKALRALKKNDDQFSVNSNNNDVKCTNEQFRPVS